MILSKLFRETWIDVCSLVVSSLILRKLSTPLIIKCYSITLIIIFSEELSMNALNLIGLIVLKQPRLIPIFLLSLRARAVCHKLIVNRHRRII